MPNSDNDLDYNLPRLALAIGAAISGIGVLIKSEAFLTLGLPLFIIGLSILLHRQPSRKGWHR